MDRDVAVAEMSKYALVASESMAALSRMRLKNAHPDEPAYDATPEDVTALREIQVILFASEAGARATGVLTGTSNLTDPGDAEPGLELQLDSADLVQKLIRDNDELPEFLEQAQQSLSSLIQTGSWSVLDSNQRRFLRSDFREFLRGLSQAPVFVPDEETGSLAFQSTLI